VNDLIPHDVRSAQEVDDLLTTIRTQGLDVLEGEPLLPYSALNKACEGRGHRSQPAPGAPEAAKRSGARLPARDGRLASAPVKGMDIAKRIERGHSPR